jgi:dsRNA-specific ribonuclease
MTDSKEIRVLVMDGPTIHGRGQGSTRKKAEQMAAKEALEKFNVNPVMPAA